MSSFTTVTSSTSTSSQFIQDPVPMDCELTSGVAKAQLDENQSRRTNLIFSAPPFAEFTFSSAISQSLVESKKGSSQKKVNCYGSLIDGYSINIPSGFKVVKKGNSIPTVSGIVIVSDSNTGNEFYKVTVINIAYLEFIMAASDFVSFGQKFSGSKVMQMALHLADGLIKAMGEKVKLRGYGQISSNIVDFEITDVDYSYTIRQRIIFHEKTAYILSVEYNTESPLDYEEFFNSFKLILKM